MAIRYVTRVVPFERRREFSGRFLVLHPREAGEVPEAVLLEARLGHRATRVALGQRLGLFFLSFPATNQLVVIIPQTREVKFVGRQRERLIAFDERASLARVNRSLRSDKTWNSRSYAFVLAALQEMVSV